MFAYLRKLPLVRAGMAALLIAGLAMPVSAAKPAPPEFSVVVCDPGNSTPPYDDPNFVYVRITLTWSGIRANAWSAGAGDVSGNGFGFIEPFGGILSAGTRSHTFGALDPADIAVAGAGLYADPSGIRKVIREDTQTATGGWPAC